MLIGEKTLKGGGQDGWRDDFTETVDNVDRGGDIDRLEGRMA